MDWEIKYAVGTKWITRSGQTAEVVAHRHDYDEYKVRLNAPLCSDHPCRIDGTIYPNGDNHPYDLISPIPSPAEVKREFKVGDLVEYNPNHEFCSRCNLGKNDGTRVVKIIRQDGTLRVQCDKTGFHADDVPPDALTLVKAVEEKDKVSRVCGHCCKEFTGLFKDHDCEFKDNSTVSYGGCEGVNPNTEPPEKPVQPTLSGYLPCVDGKTQLWWPSVKPVTIKQPHETCAMCGIYYRKHQAYRAGCVECGSVLPNSKKVGK